MSVFDGDQQVNSPLFPYFSIATEYWNLYINCYLFFYDLLDLCVCEFLLYFVSCLCLLGCSVIWFSVCACLWVWVALFSVFCGLVGYQNSWFLVLVLVGWLEKYLSNSSIFINLCVKYYHFNDNLMFLRKMNYDIIWIKQTIWVIDLLPAFFLPISIFLLEVNHKLNRLFLV